MLHIDLSRRRFRVDERPELFKHALGGTGVGIRLLEELCPSGADPLGLGEVEGRVPPGVAERYSTFLVCESCGHVYWPGSHFRRMREFLRRVRRGADHPGMLQR